MTALHRYINRSGQRFGKLVAIEFSGKDRWGNALWICQCDCGNKKVVSGNSLQKENTRSCGCLVKRHGHSCGSGWSRVYRSWSHAIQRCTNPNDKRYCDYGGRGIGICDRWRIFNNFLEDMGEPPTDKHQIDRIDNDKGYFPGNCRWATREQQARNKRNNITITHKGRTRLILQWSQELGIKYTTLRYRFCKLCWSAEKTLTTPVRGKKSD